MTVLVTGAAGFIGHYTAIALLQRGENVLGVDNMNEYYNPAIKRARLKNVKKIAEQTGQKFSFAKINLAHKSDLDTACDGHDITHIIHLAAQAGVRYSIENPEVYVESNLIGHSNILELARSIKPINTVYASSSSVYGGNETTPFSETDITDDPVSFYGATKKSNELLSNSYARLYDLSLTGLRFFTVYGPWGRPDMAYWIFADKMRNGKEVQIFNNGQMGRDFTYVDDIVNGILAAMDRPARNLVGTGKIKIPHRVYNLGNDHPEELMTMVDIIENAFPYKMNKTFKGMQQGDVERTWANIDRARAELDYNPKVSLQDGLQKFADWYKTVDY